MDDSSKGTLADRDATDEQIRRTWERATALAMEKHRQTGVPVAIWDWENHRVMLIPAEELDLPERPLVLGHATREQD